MTALVTTVRLTEALAEELELVARVDGTTASRIIRDAIYAYCGSRKSDPLFRAAAAAMIARDQARLAALGPLPNKPVCCCDQTAARLVICPVHPTASTA